ncbi:MAG TPA: flagellar filament capping protein FliD [Verrucomicrobiae bacterium]|nr:flagellar filament capping protein FliD [Verrucomicrobiae bacterium]
MSSTSLGAAIIAGSESTTSSGGLGAGIDVSTLVSAAMANQEAELQVLQNQQSTVSTQQSALTSFSNDLQTLQDAVYGLTDPVSAFTALATTSSNSSVVTASAVSGASTGTHSITVNNLATTSAVYSAAETTSSTPIPTGTLTIQVGSNASTSITIDSSNDTLDGLAQSINNASAGVTATVINDASGARLAIFSNTSGAPGNLTVTPSSGGLNFTTAATGTDASLTVDGIPVTSSSNTVTGVISGVTLNLASAAPNSPATITIEPDTTQEESAVNTFVSAYNTVIGDLNTQFSIDPTTGDAGPLASDSTLSLAQSEILSAASFSMTGNGSVNGLADLGITMNNDGTLSVDSGTLSSVLSSDPTDVQSFFQANSAGSFGSNLTNSVAALADPVTGAVAQDINGLDQTQSDLTTQINDFQTQLTALQQQLTTEYDQVDATLQALPLLIQQTQSQLASLG